MLRYVNLNEIQAMLLKVSDLTDLQDLRDFSYVAKTKRWLSDLEKILENNRLIQAGEVASLRGAIVSAENGIYQNGAEFLAKPTKRKMVEAATASAIHQASRLVAQVIQPDLTRFNEAEQLVRQLVAVAKAKGLLRNLPENGNHTETLKFIWRTIAEDTDIAAGAINVEGLTGPYDALILLDRILVSDVLRTNNQ
mgnify:FL=1